MSVRTSGYVSWILFTSDLSFSRDAVREQARAMAGLPRPSEAGAYASSPRSHLRSLATRSGQRFFARITARLWKTNPRSEEHTSELQSHLNLVCRLLLEKKKKKKNKEHTMCMPLE